jgi:hypothetical protein
VARSKHPNVAITARVKANGAKAKARKKADRRRCIDPCTTDRRYTDEEREFLMAMEAYKKRAGRPFPTWSEALEVLKGLGYRKAE